MRSVKPQIEESMLREMCEAIRNSLGDPEEGGHWHCACCDGQTLASSCPFCDTADFLVPHSIKAVEAFSVMGQVNERLAAVREIFMESFEVDSNQSGRAE